MEEIKIRKITKEDIGKLSELYDNVWPEDNGNHYEKASWAVTTSEWTGICAEVGNKIIGSRSCFHTNTFLGEDKVNCVQFGDSCVDKSHRGSGLFSKMNLAFLNDFFNNGGELIYNVSVEASKKAYQKVGWNYINSYMGLLYSPNYLKLLYKIKGHISLIAGKARYDNCDLPETGAISDDLLNIREDYFRDNRLIHSKYDIETLRWRVSTHSGIRIFEDGEYGACFYKVGEKNGMKCLSIGEVFPSQYNKNTVFHILKKLIYVNQPDLVNTSVTLSHPMYQFYRDFGFIHNPRKRFLNLGVRVDTEAMRVIAYNPLNWGLCSLDIDTF